MSQVREIMRTQPPAEHSTPTPQPQPEPEPTSRSPNPEPEPVPDTPQEPNRLLP